MIFKGINFNLNRLSIDITIKYLVHARKIHDEEKETAT